MSISTTALVASSGLVAAALVGSQVETLTRKAAEAETRTRTFEVSTSLEMVDMVMVVDGEEMEGRGMRGGATTRARTLVVSDAFEAADGTRPTKLVRTYESMTRTTEREGGEERGGPGGGGGRPGGGDRTPPELVSDLTGEDVIFVWDGEASEYAAELPEDSLLDEEVLDGLVADLELAEFLPAEAVEVDDQWQVPLETLALLVRPGGDLKLRPATDPDAEAGGGRCGGFGGRFGRPDPEELGVEPEYDGSITATLVEISGEGDDRVARIELLIEVTATLDMTDAIEDVTRETPNGEFTRVTLESVTTDEYDGTGELVWHLGAGRLVSLTIEAELSRDEIEATETVFDGEGRSMERRSTSSGTFAFGCTVD